jgi:surface protein
MFDNCSELKSLNLDNWNLSELTSYGGMFSSANSLEKVLARNWVIPRRPVTL